jgi:CRISPR/Cas system-associated endonuclease/helicase Cas3
MAHFLIFTFERFLAQNVHKLFKSLLAIIFNNLLKYANYAFIVYMCTQIKKFHTTFFHYIFHSSDTIGPFL